MSPGDRAWDGDAVVRNRKPGQAEAVPASAGCRRMAAVVALATVAGALGGALATAGFAQYGWHGNGGGEQQRTRSFGGEDRCRHARAESQPRTHFQDGDEPVQQDQRGARTASTRSRRRRPNRLPNSPSSAKPSTSSVRAPAAAPGCGCGNPVAAKEVTGTVSPPATAAARRRSPKSPGCRRGSWVLRDIANGAALIEGAGRL